MLVLRRREGEKIAISGPCVISVETIGDETVLLGFDAERSVSIVRSELEGKPCPRHRLTSDEVETVFPWDLWMNGSVHSAIRGADFPQEVEGFRSLLRSKAARALMEVATRAVGDVVHFQFHVDRRPLRSRRSRRRIKR